MLTWRIRIKLTSLVLVFYACGSATAHAQSVGSNEAGVIDGRSWDFSNRMPLRGEWRFIENKILAPDDPQLHNARTISFPSLWNDIRPGARGTGCATYSVHVLVPDGIDGWSFEIPPLYNSYNLWVNDSLIASAGIVGDRSDKTTPKWIYQISEYGQRPDTLKVVLQVANYHHYKGGASSPLYLGATNQLKAHFTWVMGSCLVEAGLLFLEGVFFLFFYRRNRKSVILYFALLCLTWSVRAMFSNVYPLSWMFPDIAWEWVVKVEYITLYLTVIWAALFFHTIFTDISNSVVTYLGIAVNLFFISFTVLTPAIIYTRWISIYLAVAAFVILYGVTMVVRALIIDKDGSWFLMGSIWTGILLFSYDIAAYHISFTYNLVLMNIGYVLIFAFTTVGLLFHIGVFKTKSVQRDYLTMKDLYS
jgi:hypothetical protein